MLAMLAKEGDPLCGKIADPAVWIEKVPGGLRHFRVIDSGDERIFVPFYETTEC